MCGKAEKEVMWKMGQAGGFNPGTEIMAGTKGMDKFNEYLTQKEVEEEEKLAEALKQGYGIDESSPSY
jgi:hypothetical protein